MAPLLLLLAACGSKGGGGDGDAATPDAGDVEAAGEVAADGAGEPDVAEPVEDARPDEGGPDAAEAGDAPGDAGDAAADEGGEAVGCADPSAIGTTLWPSQAALADRATLGLTVVREWTKAVWLEIVSLKELRYESWQVTGCDTAAVSIEAFFAIPQRLAGGGRDPGLVLAHGLGGCADADTAAAAAADLDMGVVYFSGPGNCGSEGRGNDDPDALWDNAADPRGSWFWAHAVAGARAITALEATGEVDPARIGMTGYSAGSMATINVNGFDARLRAAVPVSGVGDLGGAAAAGGWENDLLAMSGLTKDSPGFQRFLETIDPIRLAPAQHAPVLLVNGAQDEFFPIDCTVATWSAFPGSDSRLLVVPNWDHGLFAADYPLCATFDNSEAANDIRAAGQRFWFRRLLAGDTAYAEPLPVPAATMTDYGGAVAFAATITTSYTVREARVYASADGSYSYADTALDAAGGGLWYKVTPLPWATFNDTNTLYFAQLKLKAGVLGPEFWVTSLPSIPPGFAPRIRPMNPAACP